MKLCYFLSLACLGVIFLFFNQVTYGYVPLTNGNILVAGSLPTATPTTFASVMYYEYDIYGNLVQNISNTSTYPYCFSSHKT